MFRKIMLLAGVVGMISAACADTIIPGGNVSGTWAAAGSPFLIIGEITVPTGQTLNIQPGVQVIFQGHYKLIVNGMLEAVGTEQDSILFTATNSVEGWYGIRFIAAPDGSHLTYCIIKNGRALWPPNFPPDCYGGGIYADQTNLTITNSLISYNISNCGGGVFLDSCSNSSIIGSIFEYNEVNGPGSGIAYYQSGGLLRGNIFRYNFGSNYQAVGAGVYIWESSPIVKDNIFYSNTGVGPGTAIWTHENSNPQLLNNLFYQNERVALNFSNNCSAQLTGNTLYQDDNTSAMEIHYASNVSGFNNIFWGNNNLIQVLSGSTLELSYSDIQGGYLGTGNINQDPLFITGPEGDYYLSQIAAGQAANSRCVDAGNPAIPVTGTTRTDGEPDTGVPDMGFHYPVPEPIPPPQTITLTPQNPPITIPAVGGSFNFEVFISNYTTAATSFDAWINITVPGGVQFTILGPVALTLPANSSLSRMRTINVPATAPAGDYICLGAIGDYPWFVIDSDQFPFTKLGSNRDWLGAEGWLSSGEPLPGEITGGESSEGVLTDTPALQYALHPCSPNPFNPTTVLRFDLPQAGWVKLEVFDIRGRSVGAGFKPAPTSGSGPTPTTGEWYSAGTHEVTFDGSNLPSGIYLARLTVKDPSGSGPKGGLGSTTPTTATQKLVLLK